MNKKIIAFTSIFIFLILTICCLFVKEEVAKEKQISFKINKPYFQSLRSLASKESLENILEKNNAKLVKKEWEHLDLQTDFILRPRTWTVDGKLNFQIRKKDSNLGEIILNLSQKIDYSKDNLIIKVTLNDTEKEVKEYQNKIIIKPQNEITLVEISNKIKIKKTIPFFMKNYMHEKVEEFAEKDLETISENIKEQINKKKSLISIPIVE